MSKIINTLQTFDISIIIEEFNKERAIVALERVLKEIKDGDTDCSSHPTTYEPYVPYTYFSCKSSSQKIYDEEWIDQFDDEEKQAMRFIL